MRQVDRLDCLQFDDHDILDKKVNPIAVIDHQPFIPNWDEHLLAHTQRALAQFVSNTGFR